MNEPTPAASANVSNVGSSIGGSVAVILVYAFHLRGVDFPAGIEAALAALITWAGGYLPSKPTRN